MVTSSTEHGWEIPEVGSDIDQWGNYLNSTIRDIDSEVIIKGTFGDRPAPGDEGRWYLATNLLTLYYDDGSEWQTILGQEMSDVTITFDGLRVSDGSSGEPSFAFADDTDTGLYRPDTDVVSLATDGTQAFTVDENQNVIFENGDLVDDAGNTVYDRVNNQIPSERVQTNGLNAAELGGNGASYYLDHTNFSNVSDDDHHGTIQFSDDGSAVMTQPTDVSFESGLSVAEDGDGITVTATAGEPVATGNVTLSNGSAVVDTGIVEPGTNIDVLLDPSGNGANDADVKVAARAFWDDSAGEYKVEIVEDGTNIDNPDVGYEVVSS